MRRFAEDNLREWLARKNRKPLVIRGARQVGKSTLVRQFAQRQGLVLHEVNLERHRTLTSVFETLDTKKILKELEFVCGKGPLSGEKGLLFLDEIQAVPVAIQSLRYFYEDHPDLPVIAAGSLMEFALAKHSFPMPVGRIEYLFLGPMTFEEFLEAMAEEDLLNFLRGYSIREDFPHSAHERLLEAQRIFFLVGGMPEAIRWFIETRNFEDVTRVQTSITETYRDDFSKYASQSDLLRLHKVFDHVPVVIGEKLKYVKIDPNEQSRDLRRAVDLLVKAQVVLMAVHTDASGLPLGATVDPRVIKLFFLDCGLVNALCGVQRISFEEMEKMEFINKGKIAEQFIAQHLAFPPGNGSRSSLTYWLREGRSVNAEVDFVVSLNQSIVPIEVKAGKSGSLKSLQQFVHEKKAPLAVRFDLNRPSWQRVRHLFQQSSQKATVEFDLLSLPLYMVEQLPRILENGQS